MKPCDQHILQTIRLSLEMIHLADQGDADREDTGCGILYGIVRDSAYKILKLAEKEKHRHQAKGWWPEQCAIPDYCKHLVQGENTHPSSKKKEEEP